MSWNNPPPIFDHEDERALKLEYARLLAAHPERAASIGYEVFPGQENYGRAMQAQIWQHDPIVRAEVERLQRGGEVDAILPTKEQFAKEVLDEARAARDPKDKVGLFKLHAEVMGYMPKTGTNVNVVNDNSVVRNVLLVPQYQSRDDFAVEFKQQQTRLLADARNQR